jgi:hypothetical protein
MKLGHRAVRLLKNWKSVVIMSAAVFGVSAFSTPASAYPYYHNHGGGYYHGGGFRHGGYYHGGYGNRWRGGWGGGGFVPGYTTYGSFYYPPQTNLVAPPVDRYQIPDGFAGTPSGYVISWGGVNYLTNDDGTMSPYAGPVAGQ